MWLNTPINPFNQYLIPRFDIIADMANSMKSCHIYYVSIEDGLLYGCNEEPYTIHTLPIPPQFIPQKSFLFRYDTLNLEIVKRYRSFTLFECFPWALIPTENIPYSSDYIQWRKDGEWFIIDKTTGQEIDFINLYGVDTDKEVPVREILNKIQGLKHSMSMSINPTVFQNVNERPEVIEVATSKASIGTRFLDLYNDTTGKHYPIFIFRSLFNLNKNDKMDIVISDRLDNYNIFMAEFVIKRKKNPIQYIFDPYVERIYSAFVFV